MFRLIYSNLARRPARTALTAAAVALAVALVVSTTSGYASAEAALRQFAEMYLGTDDAKVRNAGEGEGIPESVLNDLRRDPAVRGAFGRLQGDRPVTAPGGLDPGGNFGVLGIDPAGDGYLARLPLDSGRKPTRADEPVAMIDLGARDALGIDVGDRLVLPGPGGGAELEVVGVVYKPRILGLFGLRTVYVPLQTMQDALGTETLSSVVIEFEVGVDGDGFVERWQRRFDDAGLALEVRLVRADREALDRGLNAMSLLSLLGGAVSLLAATFIVFGTLSMGVAERGRTLAMLRAVGATRRQVALGVVGEGVALAMLGWRWACRWDCSSSWR